MDTERERTSSSTMSAGTGQDQNLDTKIKVITDLLNATWTTPEGICKTKALLKKSSNTDLRRIVDKSIMSIIISKFSSLPETCQQNDGLIVIRRILYRIWTRRLEEDVEPFLPSLIACMKNMKLYCKACGILRITAKKSKKLKDVIKGDAFVSTVVDMYDQSVQRNNRAFSKQISEICRTIAAIFIDRSEHWLLLPESVGTTDYFTSVVLRMLQTLLGADKVPRSEESLKRVTKVFIQALSRSSILDNQLAASALLTKFLQDQNESKVTVVQDHLGDVLEVLKSFRGTNPGHLYQLIGALASCGDRMVSTLIERDVWRLLLKCWKGDDISTVFACSAMSAILHEGGGKARPVPSKVLYWAARCLQDSSYGRGVKKAVCRVLVRTLKLQEEEDDVEWNVRMVPVLGKALNDTEDPSQLRCLLGLIRSCLETATQDQMRDLQRCYGDSPCTSNILRFVDHPDQCVSAEVRVLVFYFLKCLSSAPSTRQNEQN